MQVPLIALMLTTAWTGSWKLQLEKEGEFLHLVVKDAEKIELYDDTWTPHEFSDLLLEDDRIEVRATILGSAQQIILRGQRKEDAFAGSITLKYPQFAITEECKGRRVSTEPFPVPVDWIASHRKEKRIDVVRFCAEQAPRESFESFVQFWNDEVEKSFYIFLQPFLDDSVVKTELLEKVFAQLESYTADCVELTAQRGIEVWQKEQEDNAESATIDCIVLIPPIKPNKTILRLSSIKNKYPPGVRPCCGESLYDMENFLILPVGCDETPRKEGQDDPSSPKLAVAPGI